MGPEPVGVLNSAVFETFYLDGQHDDGMQRLIVASAPLAGALTAILGPENTAPGIRRPEVAPDACWEKEPDGGMRVCR